MKSNQRGKKTKIEKFRTLFKNYLETQWKSNKKFVRDKNSVLAVDELAEVLLQSKKNQSCLGPLPARCALKLSQVIIYMYCLFDSVSYLAVS